MKTSGGKAEEVRPLEEQQPREGSSAARGKQRLVRKSTVVKQAIHIRPFISFVCL
ncbi:hypothetical protein [Priestia megaterium]|uniref:hypothetical protein n=1 Tax=Priestia megaterium TaxID=1404 RepID=UPI001403AD20|nr:hypothetical protein [Priestia megaterium]